MAQRDWPISFFFKSLTASRTLIKAEEVSKRISRSLEATHPMDGQPVKNYLEREAMNLASCSI